VAVTVNAGLTILYWQIGSRIRQDILKEKRAEYGEEIISTLSIQLVKEFGKMKPYPKYSRSQLDGGRKVRACPALDAGGEEEKQKT
jgi:hypothetical protein